MAEYVKELYSWIAFVPNMTFKNFLEIGIIAFVVYEVLVWIKNTRAWTLLKGILFICGFVLMAGLPYWNWTPSSGCWGKRLISQLQRSLSFFSRSSERRWSSWGARTC